MPKEKSLKQILLDHLNSTTGWVSKGKLGMVAEEAGCLPESCGRHLRKMAELEEIEVSYYKGKRNQTLSRYAKKGETTPIPQKPKIEISIVNGIPIATLSN